MHQCTNVGIGFPSDYDIQRKKKLTTPTLFSLKYPYRDRLKHDYSIN